MSALLKTVILALAASAIAAPAPAPTNPAPIIPNQVPPAAPPSADAQKALAELLKSKVSAIDRAKELFVDKASGTVKAKADLVPNLIFDFTTGAPLPGELGGKKGIATGATFPWLVASGLSATALFVGPCGMNTPHIHPRGNEFLTSINGTIEFGEIFEAGLVAPGKGTGEVAGTLYPWQGTMLPQGSIHYQFNPTCDPVAALAVLSDEDAGNNVVAQGFFGLNGEVVEATLGRTAPIDGAFVESFRAKIPVSLAKGVDECLAKCNIPKRKI